MKSRIGIISLESIGNGGDQMIGDTTEFLISNKDKFEITRYQLMPRDRAFKTKSILRVVISHLLFAIASILKGNTQFVLNNYGYRVRYK